MGRAIVRRSCRKSGALARRLSVLVALFGLFAAPAVAATDHPLTLAPPAAKDATAPNAAAAKRDPGKLYIDADKLNYDKNNEVVFADGGVVLYYKNRVLQADHVVYDRKNKRVKANGRVKLTDEHGDVTYAKDADLTEDFASGFADALQAFPTNKTRLTATRSERSEGAITTLENGVYTACEPCKAHPDWPPLWQIRAEQIVEDQNQHKIFFRNAYFDAFGVPIAYIPFFSAPDPTVTRQSGFLAPSYVSKNTLGLGITVPYFFNLAPNYDLTVSPSYYSLQGPVLDALWRHRLESGEYYVDVSGVDQLHRQAFLAAPYGAGNLTLRGALETKGNFFLSPNWTTGWDITLQSDRFYLNDYRLRALDPTQYFFGDLVNDVYLRGQAGRGFFDLSAYTFQPTNAFLDRRQDPSAIPTLDYHRTFEVDPEKPHGIGGEVTAEFNAANVTRSEALYQSVGTARFDPAYNLYSVCATYAPGQTYNNCLLRGIAGDYGRATEQVAWSRQYIDPLGESWKPFAFERLSGEGTSLSGGSYTYSSYTGAATIPNYAQPAFFNGATSGTAAVGMAGVGLEYRYPFVMHSGFGDQVIEPIAQLIVRPDEVLPRLQPNEDAQSLVFDDTTLFNWSKYSGYDRVEGGTRANYGVQYTASFNNGGHANIVAGQSAQVAGQNSYTLVDATNTGLESGLDKRFSNIVAGETLQPTAAPLTLGLKQQFGSNDGSLQRFDGILGGKWANFEGSFDYARYAAQPLLGWAYPREGLTTMLSYKFPNNFVLTAGLTLDMSRHYYDTNYGSPFYPTQYNVGLAYTANDCTTFKVVYNSTLSVPISTNPGVPAAPATRDQTLIFELNFRTLGDVKTSSAVN